MLLDAFIQQIVDVLGTDVDEILVKQDGVLRENPGPREWAFVDKFNTRMSADPTETAKRSLGLPLRHLVPAPRHGIDRPVQAIDAHRCCHAELFPAILA